MLVLARRLRLVVLPCVALCLSVAGCSSDDADDAGAAADTTAVAVSETTEAAVPVDSSAAVASSNDAAP